MQGRASLRLAGIAPALACLLFACGDSAGSSGSDELGETSMGSEGSAGSGNMEAGSGMGSSSSEGESCSSEAPEGSGSGDASEVADAPEGGPDTSATDTTGGTDTNPSGSDTSGTTETGEPPIECTLLDELECGLVDGCTPYLGQPFDESIDGMACLGTSEFLGCLFAADACLPATGTLCAGQQAFHVDNLCPVPEGFAACDPPLDPPPPSCMP